MLQRCLAARSGLLRILISALIQIDFDRKTPSIITELLGQAKRASRALYAVRGRRLRRQREEGADRLGATSTLGKQKRRVHAVKRARPVAGVVAVGIGG
ncbi:MAG: hypothetical protein K2W95_35945 [Candidatus Obscuribacterales bacterium]|nr:hypothetical protein [Candidatus Obscuribacterales bacterium]